jgi:hypothetical protein
MTAKQGKRSIVHALDTHGQTIGQATGKKIQMFLCKTFRIDLKGRLLARASRPKQMSQLGDSQVTGIASTDKYRFKRLPVSIPGHNDFFFQPVQIWLYPCLPSWHFFTVEGTVTTSFSAERQMYIQ